MLLLYPHLFFQVLASSDLPGHPLETQERSGIHQTLSEINYLINGLSDVNSADARCHKYASSFLNWFSSLLFLDGIDDGLL